VHLLGNPGTRKRHDNDTKGRSSNGQKAQIPAKFLKIPKKNNLQKTSYFSDKKRKF
jgi:hypothetical protein